MMLTAVLLAGLVAQTSATVTGTISEQWWGGFKYSFTVAESSTVESWCYQIDIGGGDIDGFECDWATVATKNGAGYKVCNNANDGHIDGGSSFLGECVVRCSQACSGNSWSYSLHLTEEGGSGGSGPAATSAPGGGATNAPQVPSGNGGTAPGTGGGATVGNSGGQGTKPYGDALKKSILFYDAQRSGTLPGNNPISWRGNSAEGDCVNGGWYDAGDHVKFGLPFGEATNVLLWGMYAFKDGYEQAGALDSAYDSVRWATDYMLKAYDAGSHQLVAQIGDGDADHSYWGPPEGMNMNRPCYKVGPGKTAAELYGEWAGALAAGYLVFKDKGETDYANRMLTNAKSMYDFGKANPGTYSNSIPNIGRYYGSTNYKDEMCVGAIWLYRATGEAKYLQDAKSFHSASPAWALSWDDKNVECQLLLFQETQENSYKSEVQAFLHDWMPGGSVAYTPCGLAFRDKWGSNRYAGNAAFVALAAADAGINSNDYAKWAVEQINYILGDNHINGGCFSFEIGIGGNFPRHPHHRGASSTGGHQLDGALVGGPDGAGGSYQDDQGNYVTNEVAIDYNAGFQGALAGINHLIKAGGVPATNNKCQCN